MDIIGHAKMTKYNEYDINIELRTPHVIRRNKLVLWEVILSLLDEGYLTKEQVQKIIDKIRFNESKQT